MKEFSIIITENIPSPALNAINLVLGSEGGYVDDPNDRGGKTNFGISDLRDGVSDNLVDINLDGIGDIAPENLTREQAIAIYYHDYWLKNHCHELPPAIATMVFDTAVNQGGSFARKTLQKVLGVKQDGIIGNQTLAATSLVNGTLTLIDYTKLRCQRYSDLVQKHPKQSQFINGWLNRAFLILSECHLLLNKHEQRGIHE